MKKQGEKVKKAKTYALHFQTGNFFTRNLAYGVCAQRFARTALTKVAARNRANQAGATPSRRKIAARSLWASGVTPASCC